MIRIQIISLIFGFLFFSCNIKTSEQSLPESVGKYGQILIIIDTTYENSSTGRLLDSILTQQMHGLPQIEPLFSVNTVPHAGFKDILKRASNIISISVSNNAKAVINVNEDVWAKGQIVVDIKGKSKRTVDQIIKSNAKNLTDIFNNKELERWNAQLLPFLNRPLNQQLIDSHNISLNFSDGFHLMDSREDDFWVKKEKTIGCHQVIQALMVYYYPYTSDSTFAVSEMIAKRNAYTFNYIQGMTDSSYMAVYKEYPPSIDTLSLNGLYSVEYRGLWNMQNDFMGGPFLHYTVLDEKNNRIINLDAFVYAPKFNKREYVREMEAIAHSLKIPS